MRRIASRIKSLWLILLISFFSFINTTTMAAESATDTTYNKIKKRGVLKCGVGNNDPGFAQRNIDGTWIGFDVDFCRAIAAATLGNANAVDFLPLDSLNRLNVLQRGDIDVLLRTTTWTYSRDTSMGLDFTGTIFFDTQGILAHKQSGVTNFSDLAGKTICANRGTTSLNNLKEAIKQSNLAVKVLELASQEGRWRAFLSRECDAVTADKSDLLAKISTFKNSTEKYFLLDENVSNEPLSPAVRDDDRQWFDIVKWVVFSTITAEQLGMSSENAVTYQGRLNHLPSNSLGLPQDWVKQVILQVGNYQEIFDRNIGINSPIKLDRGNNKLVQKGGLLYAMPFR